MKQKLPTAFRIPHTLQLYSATDTMNGITNQKSTIVYLGIHPRIFLILLISCMLSLVLGLNTVQAQIGNAPTNVMSPWITGTYSDVQATIESGVGGGILCVGTISGVANLTDADLTNSATINFTAALSGCNATLSVADPINTYPAGTWAGFRVGTAGLLGVSVGLNVTISTFNDGVATADSDTFDAGLISAN